MANIYLGDRIKETISSTGTGTLSLGGAIAGYRAFSTDVTNGGLVTYVVEDTGNTYEVGLGTYSGSTITRDTILSSSNSNNRISNSTGAAVFLSTVSNYLPYKDSNGNLGLGTGTPSYRLDVLGTGRLDALKLTPAANPNQPAYEEGVFFYDDDNKALTIYNDEPDISLQIGQENYIRVRNNQAYDITNGQAVYIVGSQGTNLTIDLAIASGLEEAHAIGIATHDIESNSFGYVATFGFVRNINTAGFIDGQEIYLSPTVSGGWTTELPIAPNYRTTIGYIVRAHASVGSLFVSPTHARFGGGDVSVSGNGRNISGVPFIVVATLSGDMSLDSDSLFVYDDTNNRLGINTPTPQYTLDVSGIMRGTLHENWVETTGDYTITSTGYGVFISASGDSTITLPDVSLGRGAAIKRVDTSQNTVTITGANGIDGLESLNLGSYDSVVLVSSSTQWHIK